VNPVLTLTHNNIELTERCVESVRNQDVTTEMCIIDNGSTDGTNGWLFANRTKIQQLTNPTNEGVSRGWNRGIGCFLQDLDYPHILVIGNDTVLPPWFYRTILSVDMPFVTGVAVDNMEQAMQPACVMPLTPNPDFSAFLIRRECWDKVGQFNEAMKHYCSDCDYHVRAHRLGVPLVKASIPFYHERSSTLRLAPPEEQQEIQSQANMDRAVFYQLYGCLPGTEGYEAIFK
jgi:GT2 family glycosyltransferase